MVGRAGRRAGRYTGDRLHHRCPLLHMSRSIYINIIANTVLVSHSTRITYRYNQRKKKDGGGRQGLEDPSREAIPVSEETSRRLAVTNCDWDNMRARDLIVLCGSFCPASARLSSVTVYPSDFGLKMMRVEAAAGPHAALASNG